MTFGRKVVKEWFHNNKKIETRRIKAYFNSGANIGKALQQADAEKSQKIELPGEDNVNENTQEESKEPVETNEQNVEKQLTPTEEYQKKLKEIKVKYAKHKIFIHPCSYCKEWSQALHL